MQGFQQAVGDPFLADGILGFTQPPQPALRSFCPCRLPHRAKSLAGQWILWKERGHCVPCSSSTSCTCNELLVLFGCVVAYGYFLAVVTLVPLFLTSTTNNDLSSLLIGLVPIVLRAVLPGQWHNADDEVGCWYAPVPQQPLH
ncbi:unnamed protein product [Urochloa humidicola]